MTDKIRLVCGYCEIINQFPISRLDQSPRCANCKHSLFSGEPIKVSASALAKQIKNSDLPILVDFWAPWCRPCQSFIPVFNSFAGQVGNQLILLKVDTETHQQTASDFNIRSIPTLLLFRKGQELARISGALNLPQLQQWVVQELTNAG